MHNIYSPSDVFDSWPELAPEWASTDWSESKVDLQIQQQFLLLATYVYIGSKHIAMLYFFCCIAKVLTTDKCKQLLTMLILSYKLMSLQCVYSIVQYIVGFHILSTQSQLGNAILGILWTNCLCMNNRS